VYISQYKCKAPIGRASDSIVMSIESIVHVAITVIKYMLGNKLGNMLDDRLGNMLDDTLVNMLDNRLDNILNKS
jgi:hypothetical protein